MLADYDRPFLARLTIFGHKQDSIREDLVEYIQHDFVASTSTPCHRPAGIEGGLRRADSHSGRSLRWRKLAIDFTGTAISLFAARIELREERDGLVHFAPARVAYSGRSAACVHDGVMRRVELQIRRMGEQRFPFAPLTASNFSETPAVSRVERQGPDRRDLRSA